ncbi:hypothetical protein SLEP1_g18705 [Rubroshorea leprosula]|uniref:Uncharacterized protein n=1 Tax=Rubroshorea leprosula TaxID=152421 RepID=A0AAV5J7J5_9ROSI|nr:hypothetical protein SLEP1_g18705 [Rubroshorea leprosula]
MSDHVEIDRNSTVIRGSAKDDFTVNLCGSLLNTGTTDACQWANTLVITDAYQWELLNTGTITDAYQWEFAKHWYFCNPAMELNIGYYCARQWEVYKHWP